MAKCLVCCRFKVEGELKYLTDAENLVTPERCTLSVSFLDVEEYNLRLSTLIGERYYQ